MDGALKQIETGQTFEVACPFIRTSYTGWDEDGSYVVLSWKPGVLWEMVGPEDAEMRAHGIGKVRYHVVAVCPLPRPYPTRVFFTRRWVTPDGREFGTRKLHVMTLDAFRRRTISYRPAGSDQWSELIVRDMDADERRKELAA